MKEWCKSSPESFHRTPYDRPGCYSYQTLYVDGGNGVSDDFFAWVAANLVGLEAIVISGGKLFLNAAGWSLPGPYAMPFGTTLTEEAYIWTGTAIDPAHPLFAGAGTSWSGLFFLMTSCPVPD